MKKVFNCTKINPVSAYFLTLGSNDTISSYKFRLQVFCEFTFKTKDFSNCDWSKLSYVDVLYYIEQQKSKGNAHTSINVSVSAIKGVTLHAWQLGLIDVNTYMQIKTIKNIRGKREPSGRALNDYEITNIRNELQSSSTIEMKRDIAMLFLAAGAGLRRKELRLLDVNDVAGNNVKVCGKGNKIRYVYIIDAVRKAIDDWLIVRKTTDNALFVRFYRNKKTQGGRLSVDGVHQIISGLHNKIGCERFTTHDLRRTFATLMLDNDADKFAVKRLMGHSSLNTLDIYDRRSDLINETAIKLLPF